ncbi:MAG: glycosyltransferase family 2 protein [Chloroflexi bacterium]|nr:glycosyltransferase family 2 protein [Chloroflexota bacterium]
MLSIIIVSWNIAPLVSDCLRSIPAGAGNLEYRVIVVDNASTDSTPERVAQDFPEVKLIRNSENAGFARANNQGIRSAEGSRYVLLLNGDTIVKAGALATMARFMDQHPGVGACGPRLVRPDGRPQPYAFGNDPTLPYIIARRAKQRLFRRDLHDWAASEVREVDWVSGACLMVRDRALQQVGLLDDNMFMYFEDNDWCLRIRKAGWKVCHNPMAEVIHLGGQSLAKNPSARQEYHRSLRYFYAKHYGPFFQRALDGLLALYSGTANA